MQKEINKNYRMNGAIIIRTDLPEKLTSQPDEVADDIYKAQQKGKDILYTKWFWKWIMVIIRMIPEWKFKRMSI